MAKKTKRSLPSQKVLADGTASKDNVSFCFLRYAAAILTQKRPSPSQSVFAYQVFGYLYGIQSRSLLDLVAYNPERQSAVIGQILADTSHIDGILACKEERHGVFLGSRVVHQHQSFSLGKSFAGFFHFRSGNATPERGRT